MHRRKSLYELFFTDPEMTTPQDLKVPSLAEFDRIFEALRRAPSSFDSQTTRCIIRTATRDGAVTEAGGYGVRLDRRTSRKNVGGAAIPLRKSPWRCLRI